MPYLDYTLSMVNESGRLELSDDRVTIGRGPNHLQLAEHYCSREHLILTRDSDGGYWVEESPCIKNITVLNGVRLMPGDRRRLREGDVIRVGGSLLAYHE